MHETGIVRGLVRRLEQAAAEAGAVRVAAVDVWLGALSQFSPEHFREHFDEAARGTVAERALLRLELSDDIGDPHAQGVVIRSVDFEVPDQANEAS